MAKFVSSHDNVLVLLTFLEIVALGIQILQLSFDRITQVPVSKDPRKGGFGLRTSKSMLILGNTGQYRLGDKRIVVLPESGAGAKAYLVIKQVHS